MFYFLLHDLKIAHLSCSTGIKIVSEESDISRNKQWALVLIFKTKIHFAATPDYMTIF